MFQDLGLPQSGQVWSDASAALGIISRQGLGRLRHVDTQWLWVQEQAEKGKLVYSKVPSSVNAADLFTKVLAWEAVAKHCSRLNLEFVPTHEEGKESSRVASFEPGFLGVQNMSEPTAARLRNAGIGLWVRHDLKSSALKSSCKFGPEWSQVLGRLTLAAGTGEVVARDFGEGLRGANLHRRLPSGPLDTVTVLFFSNAGAVSAGSDRESRPRGSVNHKRTAPPYTDQRGAHGQVDARSHLGC